MDLNVLAYLVYLAMALPLTFYVARTLHRFGKVFLLDVFNGDDALAHAVNQLLLTGFYLLNIGYVALFMTAKGNITDARRLFEVVSTKIGAVALVVGVLHFANVWAFNAFRRRAVLRARAIGPVTPNAYTAVPPPGWAGWAPQCRRAAAGIAQDDDVVYGRRLVRRRMPGPGADHGAFRRAL